MLILTANYGNGHIQVARALQERFALNDRADVSVRNIYQETNPRLNEWTRKLYLKSFTKSGKHLYRLFYYSSQEITKRQNILLFPYGYSTLNKIIEEEQPDAIINTYPSYAVEYFSKKTNKMIPTFTVVTDYCLHHAWIQPSIEKYYVATKHLQTILENNGVERNKIAITGIPVGKQFEESLSRSFLFNKYQLNPNLKTVLIVAGAYGVSKEIKYICEELQKNKNLQILVVCGKNEQLFTQLQEKYQLENNIRLFKYVTNMEELFDVATCVITKPGGIILSEATVKKVPIVLLGATPGQEKENALYFQNVGAAIFCEKWGQIAEEAQYLVMNEERLKKMKSSLAEISVPDAAKTIVQDVLDSYFWKKEKIMR
ncbi:glycosyltransferase [Robertmurraya sp. 2P01SA]|uniref:MGDG synthase family glycosyltransferase n=1 Tax=Robertmurraya sp. 2P01SA TaxID=3132300 RepID=UPI0039A5646D